MEAEELSSILMRIIRTLSESDSGEQREEEKKRLQVQFRESDQLVDQLVFKKQRELSKVMQLYARVSNRLAVARTRVAEINAGLRACKELLHYKRDDLKKHWLEGVEQKHVLELMEAVQELKQTPDRFDNLMSEKNYVDSTNLIVRSMDKLRGDLKDVEGLSEIRTSLEKKREKLYVTLMKQLDQLLYHGSAQSGFTKNVYSKNITLEEKDKKSVFMDDNVIDDFLDKPSTSQNKLDDTNSKLVLNIQCLHHLHKIGNAVEGVRINQFNELQAIIHRTTNSMKEMEKGYSGNLLASLFSSIVDQFISVAHRCDLLSRTMARIAVRNNVWCQVKLEQSEVWAKIQSAVQVMLTEYLDFDNKLTIHQPTTAQFSEPTSDINSYFVRRRTTRSKNASLFRFNASSTALSILEVSSETQGSEKADRNSQLICPPNPHNITMVYSCLMDFINLTEASLKYDTGKHCTLYGFLMDYIKDVFLGQIHADHSDTLNEASILLDSWKAITDVEVLRDYRASKPLLQSPVVIIKAIEQLLQYMNDLPLYSEHFLTMVCSTVMQYKEICLAAYRGLTQPDSEDKRIISAQWAKDETIAKILKSLPNWIALRSTNRDMESVDDIDQRNDKEAKILKENLGTYVIPSHEILQDSNQLRSLGLLLESMEWFSDRVTHVMQKLQRANDSTIGGMQKLSSNSIQTLLSLSKEFEDIAHTCLLILHLEVRLHCFFHLAPLRSGPAGALFYGGQDSTDPSQEVVRLNSDLLQIEEVLSGAVEERKIIYIFEGVSHLASIILMDAVTNIRKINKNGVRKMCRNIFSIQQTLTSNITGRRESSLDNAKQYYELLNLRPQDILNEVVEKGPMFSTEKYTHLLELLHRSDANSSVEIHERYANKLNDIMKRIGVTV